MDLYVTHEPKKLRVLSTESNRLASGITGWVQNTSTSSFSECQKPFTPWKVRRVVAQSRVEISRCDP